MGLFDKIKKIGSDLGSVGAVAGGVAAGASAGQALSQETESKDGIQNSSSEEGVKTDPSENIFDGTFKSSDGIPDGISFNTSAPVIPNDLGVTYLNDMNVNEESIITEHVILDESLSEDTPHLESTGNLFNHLKEVNQEIPVEIKSAGFGIPDQSVDTSRTYQEINLQDKNASFGYESKHGLETTYNTSHTGQDEITPGINLNSQSSYNARNFLGASSQEDTKVKWDDEQVHIHSEGRAVLGAEASIDANYKGQLDIEGVDAKPEANANVHAEALAGAEAKYRGDMVASSEGAQGDFNAGAFVGAKAGVSAAGNLGVDGDDFARGKGNAEAWAGAGAEANLKLGYQNGQFTFGTSAGAAYGVGAKFGYEVSVDAPGILTHPDAVIESINPQETVEPYLAQANGYLEESSNYLEDNVNSLINTPKLERYTEEVTGYVETASSYIDNPISYAEQVTSVVETSLEVPQEVNQVAEDIGSSLEDLGNSIGLGW